MKIVKENKSLRSNFYKYYIISFSCLFLFTMSIFYFIANKIFYNIVLNNAIGRTNIMSEDIDIIIEAASKNYLKSVDDYMIKFIVRKNVDLNKIINELKEEAIDNKVQISMLDEKGDLIYSNNNEDINRLKNNNIINQINEGDEFFYLDIDGEEYIYHIINVKDKNITFISRIKRKDLKEYILREYLNVKTPAYANQEEYTYVLDTQGNVIIHPFYSNRNINDLKDYSGNSVLNQMVKNKNGIIRYKINTDTAIKDEKRITQYSYIKEFDWIVATSISEETVINRNVNVIITSVLMVLIACFIAIVIITFFAIKEIRDRINFLDNEINEYLILLDHNSKINYKSKNEIYRLKEAFDVLMKKNKEYSDSLVNKNVELENEVSNREQIIKNSLLDLKEKSLREEKIRELSNFLQNCYSEKEIYEVLSYTLPHIFVGSSGGLYIKNAKKILIEKVSWGNLKLEETVRFCDCWALKTNYIYFRSAEHKPLCKHCIDDIKTYICFPIFDEGKIIGLLNIDYNFEMSSSKKGEFRRLSGIISETIAINIANIRIKKKLTELSTMDSLTSILNRRYLEEVIKNDRIDKNTALLMMDLDDFKKVNDKNGHVVGDQILVKFSKLVKMVLEEDAIFLRYGGEEFLIIIKNVDKSKAIEYAQKIRKRVFDCLKIKEYGVACTVSIGMIYNTKENQDINMLIEKADNNLYIAKGQGKNRVVYSDEDLKNSN
ncbi:diguanylate cyclase (GGDEF) domain-containing protein [Clostridium cavendishii DSM 21758]|uniref:Diguanylate cyclase (GGDEF) domain-containing protein n=1 Tax=Clostridium cavendishii DSM 21758 TaxID=1121302 RepID=A0A1M6LX29_9CLOT|nr:diguanylate cyclase [Clostridium cavendishii]SHJ75758.1 diguanylate cyclase (GGDEF) domain-containing protein [Clostridium cavendishii DSM 21758]